MSLKLYKYLELKKKIFIVIMMIIVIIIVKNGFVRLEEKNS
jgi:hypothetical protein